MRKEYKNISTGEERALYGISDAEVVNCRFEGPEDGESALKETHNISVSGSFFDLRYPVWHSKDTVITNSEMTDKCRAALWYDENIVIKDSILHGIKVIRDCNNVVIENCDIVSDEFVWNCNNVVIKNSKIESVYPFLMSRNVHLINCDIKAKYMFQYAENCLLENCTVETKDAFWNSKNVKIKDSSISSEYIAWYSSFAEFDNCSITGTQPFCYCDSLVLKNCEMHGCDFSFEKSSVDADIRGRIDSIRGPVKGTIKADEIGEVLPSSSGDDKIEAEIILK